MRLAFLLFLCISRVAFSQNEVEKPVNNQAIKSEMVPVNGINMHVLEKGEGPVVLFLHGFPSYSGSWKRYLETLSDQFRVVAPDMRGYNLSSQPQEVDAYKIEVLMRDILALTERLGGSKVCLVGHDWGGLLSWYLAAHHPEAFSKLVIMNAPHPKIYQSLYGKDLDQTLKASYVPVLIAPFSEKLLAAADFKILSVGLFGQSTYQFGEDEKAEIYSAWDKGLLGPVSYYRSYIPRQKQLAAEMPRITVPTKVLWGEKDAALSIKNLDGLDQYVEDLSVTRYPDATHWVNYEKVDELAAEIRSFCGE